MEKIVLLALSLSLLLVAGCSTISSPPASPVHGTASQCTPVQVSPSQISPSLLSPGNSLRFNEPVVLKNQSYVITASVSQIQVDSKGPDNHVIDIYITVTNTGTQSIRPVWYSKITDMSGKSHGGIGVSHGGSGATGNMLAPGYSHTARDYVLIDSDKDYSELAKGATLEVLVTGSPSMDKLPVYFRTAWNIPPGFFK